MKILNNTLYSFAIVLSVLNFTQLEAAIQKTAIQKFRNAQEAQKAAEKAASDARKQVKKEGSDAKAIDLRSREEALKKAQEAAEAARKEAQAEAVKNQEAHKKALDELNKAKQAQKGLAKELKGKQEALSQDFFDTRKRIENLNKQIDVAEDQRDIDLVRELEMQRGKEEEKYERLVRDNKISSGEIKLIESGEKIENLKNQIAVAQENKQDDLVNELDARLSSEEEEFNQLISRHKISDEKVNLILSQNTVSAAEEKLGKAKSKIDIAEHAEFVSKAAKDLKKQSKKDETEKKTIAKEAADKVKAAEEEKKTEKDKEVTVAKQTAKVLAVPKDKNSLAKEHMRLMNMSETEMQAILKDQKKIDEFLASPDSKLKEMRFALLDNAQNEFHDAEKAFKQADKERDKFTAKNKLSQEEEKIYSKYQYLRKKDEEKGLDTQESEQYEALKETLKTKTFAGKTAAERYEDKEDKATSKKVIQARNKKAAAEAKLAEAQKAIVGKDVKIAPAVQKSIDDLSNARKTYQKAYNKAEKQVGETIRSKMKERGFLYNEDNKKYDEKKIKDYQDEYFHEIERAELSDRITDIRFGINRAESEVEKQALRLELERLKIREEQIEPKVTRYSREYDDYSSFKNIFNASIKEKKSLFTDVKNATKQVQRLEEKLRSSDKVESKKLSTKQKAGIGAGITLGLVGLGGIIAGAIEGAEDTTNKPDTTFEQSGEGSDQEIVRAEETSESVIEPTGQTVVGSQGYEFND